MPLILKSQLGRFKVNGADIGPAWAVTEKEFARWKAQRGLGLGDVVFWVARAVGIGLAVKWVEKGTGRKCGCPKRRDKLNKIRIGVRMPPPVTSSSSPPSRA